MKVLKILAFLLSIIIIAGAILNYISPNEVHVHQSIDIAADSDVVYEHVSKFELMNQWQPRLKLDTSAQVRITGVDGQKGTISTWSSKHKDVGEGEQELTMLNPNKRVESEMRFKVPQASQRNEYFDMDEVDGKVKVTWGMNTDVSFPINVMMKFSKVNIEKQFSVGLKDLKVMCESVKPMPVKEMPKAKGSYAFSNIQRPLLKFLIKRETITMEEMPDFFQVNMPQLYMALTAAGGEMSGAPSGLYFNFDEENNSVDMAVAIPVKEAVQVEGYSMFEQPAGMAIKTTYFGSYEGGVDAHYAMDAHMKKAGYILDKMVLEEYITDPTTVSDPSEIQTDIYYYVSKKINM